MIVLGIEGALGIFSVAVVRDGHVLAAQETGGSTALEGGLLVIDSVLKEAGMRSLNCASSDASFGMTSKLRTTMKLDRIGVGIGPGRFTGARIAISYAKALALAWGVPLVGISSFDLVPEDVAKGLGERDFTVATLEPSIRTPAISVALLAAAREPEASLHAVRADYGDHPGARVPEFKPTPRAR